MAIADELRGAVDGWNFKICVLGTMFYRYISEGIPDEIEARKKQYEYYRGNLLSFKEA